jgi:protein O-mannosyl-transferase
MAQSGKNPQNVSRLKTEDHPEHLRTGIICAALALATFALFSPALSHEFLAYDDQQYVTENPRVLAGLTWQGAKWAFATFYASNWHPLTWLSHMLDAQLYGVHPLGHHLTNVLFHVTNVALLFLLLRQITGFLWRSAVVAALFAWHPLHVESVAWIAERKDVLSTFFFLLMLMAYVRYARAKPHALPFYCATLVLFAMALMSKPMVVTAPFVMLLFDFWPLQRITLESHRSSVVCRLLLEKAPFLLLSAAASYIAVLAQGRSYSIVSASSLSFRDRALHSLAAYAHYLGAMVAPTHLAAYYPYQSNLPAWQPIAEALVLLAISAIVIATRRRRPWLPVGWFWFLGTLIPVIGLVQVGDQAWADRYTYLPLVGLFIAIVWELVTILCNRPLQTANCADKSIRPPARIVMTAALVSALLITLAIVTELQLRYWRNTRTLFAHAAAVTDNNGRALAVLGSLLAREGKIDEAITLYRQALVYKPYDPEAHFFLGNAFDEQGKLAEAISEYQQALWFRPLRERTHLALASVFSKQRDFQAAAGQYRLVLEINPESAIAHNNLARLLHTDGKLDEAIAHYTAAIKLDPQLPQARNNLGVLLLQKGRVAEGATELRQALRLRPDNPETQYNLALALSQLGEGEESIHFFAKLAISRQNDPKFHFEFGQALQSQRKTHEAMSHYARALLLRPQYPEALEELSWILATDPRPEFRNGEEALRMATSACDLTQNKQPKMLLTLAAAYAETGRFAEAKEAIEKARQLLSSDREEELVAKCESVAQSITARKAWREPMN